MLVTTPTPTALRIQCRADTAELQQVRTEIRNWLDDQGHPRGAWDVVVTELVSNAIHANTDGPLEIMMELDGEACHARVECSVTNQGVWDLDTSETATRIEQIVARNSRPIDILPSGRGLGLIRALTSGGLITVLDGTTTVRVWADIPSEDQMSESAECHRTRCLQDA